MTSKSSATSAESILRDCVGTLESVATYRLPPAIDRRLLWLAENKERLSESEHEELDALAEFSEQRTFEKVRAQALLKRVRKLYPHLIPMRS